MSTSIKLLSDEQWGMLVGVKYEHLSGTTLEQLKVTQMFAHITQDSTQAAGPGGWHSIVGLPYDLHMLGPETKANF